MRNLYRMKRKTLNLTIVNIARADPVTAQIQGASSSIVSASKIMDSVAQPAVANAAITKLSTKTRGFMPSSRYS